MLPIIAHLDTFRHIQSISKEIKTGSIFFETVDSIGAYPIYG